MLSEKEPHLSYHDMETNMIYHSSPLWELKYKVPKNEPEAPKPQSPAALEASGTVLCVDRPSDGGFVTAQSSARAPSFLLG